MVRRDCMDKKIKIIWIASNAPYDRAPAAGGQTFNYYIKGFKKDKRFDVRLVCWGDINKKEEIEKENRDIVHHVIYTESSIKIKLKKLKNVESMYNPWNKNANLISNYCADEIFRILIQYKSEGYFPDYIILEWTNTVVLSRQIKKIFPFAKLVASEHDVTFVGYKRKKDYFSGIKKIQWMQKYNHEKKTELEALKLCNHVLPHNADNRNILLQNGIDEKKIKWLVPYFNNMENCKRKSNHKDILFFGAMSRPENYLSALWFINNVMPLLNDLNIRFIVLGSKPSDELKNIKSDKVIITGFVDNIEPYFESAMCLVAPLVLGAGIKVKILESLSSGIPVLTNDIGIEGIQAVHEREYFHCTEPSEYEKYIRALYNKEIDEEKLEENSRQFMKKNFDIKKSLNDYKEMLLLSED